MYKFSEKSLKKLEGVDPKLARVMRRAIEISKVDFGILEGKRTFERQKDLVAQGKSRTLTSKHLKGRAVDVFAWVDGKVSWELAYYDLIADAVKEAATEYGCKIRWGAAWHIPDIAQCYFSGEDMRNDYIDMRISQDLDPFIDSAHFELND